MFGYIKPYKPDLKISEFEIYRSVYCKLCKVMGKEFGFLSRALLSYDCTFLSMLSISFNYDKIVISKHRCTCNCLKKCNYIDGYDKDFSFAAAVGVIMAYYKIQDNIQDSKSLKKLKFYVPLCAYYRCYKKASQKYPDVNSIVKKFMTEQRSIEERETLPSVDESAHPTATALASIFSIISNQLRDFGYFLGRWIYIMDAANDLQDDIFQNNFNPLKPIKNDNVQINEILNQTAFNLISSCEDIDFKKFSPIVHNIIHLGLSETQKAILFKERRDSK